MGRTRTNSRIIDKSKIVKQCIQYLSLVARLLLIVFARVFARTISQYFGLRDAATADTSLAVGIISVLLYAHMVSVRVPYRLPIVTASEQKAKGFLVALRCASSRELLETVRFHLRASPLQVRFLPSIPA
jgi:hypothetical protein